MPKGYRKKPGTVPFSRSKPKISQQAYYIKKEDIPKKQSWYTDNTKMKGVA